MIAEPADSAVQAAAEVLYSLGSLLTYSRDQLARIAVEAARPHIEENLLLRTQMERVFEQRRNWERANERIARLDAALKEIADPTGGTTDPRVLQDIARQALAGEDTDA